MKIRNKLLLNFASLIVLMLLGFLFSVGAAYHENQDKAALNTAYELSLATESVRHQIVENHLSLSNFLITGTPAELDRLHEGHSHAADLLREAESKAGDADLAFAAANGLLADVPEPTTFALTAITGVCLLRRCRAKAN